MNRRSFVIFGLLIFGVIAFLALSPASTPQPIISRWGGQNSQGGLISGEAQPAARPDNSAEMDAYLAQLASAGQWSGSALVASGGKVLLAKGYGLSDVNSKVANTPDTRLRLASVTKQFTAMAVMQLVNDGKLQLTSSVCSYVPQCPQAWQPITIHNLLTHTSGLQNFTDLPSYEPTMAQPTSPEELVGRFRDLPLLSTPGSAYRYGNSGYVLLGYIIEQVSGQSYPDYLRSHIFEPLGMSNSGFDVGVTGVAQGYSSIGVPCARLDATTLFSAGGLYSSANDLYRWDQALYTSKLLPDSLRAEIFTPQVGSYGYGWIITARGGQRVVEHPGLMSGAATEIARLPDAGITVIVLSNLENADVGGITNHLIDLALGG